MNLLNKLSTENENEKTENLDLMSVGEIISVMNEEDGTVAKAVKNVLPEVEKAIETVYQSLSNNGRLFYIGAGTSGRIGLLDAVECPPTFSTSPQLVQAVLAGGHGAVMVAVEGAEDDSGLGEKELKKYNLSSEDVVIGITASGRTPYVKGALAYAQSIGASTVSVTSNRNSIVSQYATIAIEVDTGPEILTGSTRLKAATAHKMILNMISTATMIRLGKVYKNLMVDVKASNYKLKERAKKIVCDATNVTYAEAEKVLEQTNYAVKPAILMIMTETTFEESTALLNRSNGHVRKAIQQSDND